MQVFGQVVSQFCVVAGAITAALSPNISSTEKVAPGLITDVGLAGLALSIVSAGILIWISTSEARKNADRASREAEASKWQAENIKVIKDAVSELRPAQDTREIVQILSDRKTREVVLAAMEEQGDKAEDDRTRSRIARLVELIRRGGPDLYEKSLTGGSLNTVGIFKGLDLFGVFSLMQEILERSNSPLSVFLNTWLKTFFVPASLYFKD